MARVTPLALPLLWLGCNGPEPEDSDTPDPTPPIVAIVPASPTTVDDLVAVIEQDSANVSEPTYLFLWASSAGGTAEGATLPASATTRGETWSVTATLSVPDGPSATASATILNTAPTLEGVVFDPPVPASTSDLACVPVGAADVDGDSVTVDATWTVNGTPLSVTGLTLAASHYAFGDAVKCTAVPTDGIAPGAPVSVEAAVANLPPVLDLVRLTPTAPTAGDDLTCAAGPVTDPDGDAVTLAYRWFLNGTLLPLATSAVLPVGTHARGDVVQCSVIPSDASGAGGEVFSPERTILNALPQMASVHLTTPAYTDTTITCTPVDLGDADADSVTTHYAWTVNGNAAGTNANTLAGSAFAKGDLVRCTVTPYDTLEQGIVAYGEVGILNSPPAVSQVTIGPSPAYTASTLTCTPTTSDADGDAVTPHYAWTVNGAFAGGDSATLAGTAFDEDDQVVCTVTAHDGAGPGEQRASDPTIIQNTAPSIESAAITPDPARTNDTLTCTPSGWFDADSGDVEDYTYAWTVNGVSQGGDSPTLAGSAFAKGNTVICTVTPTDGQASGVAQNDSITISNSPPSLAAVSLTPTTAYEASTMTCAPSGWTDPDGDAQPATSATFAWTVNGSTVNGQTASTLTGTYFNKGNTVRCIATPTDGTTAGVAVDSNTVTIANSAPTLASVSLTPTTAYEASTMTCSPGTWSDPDGDPQPGTSATYTWTVNGATVSGQTSSTLTGTYFNKGQTVRCTATPTDGTTAGSPVNSNTVTISNTAPTLGTVSLTPTTAYETSTMTCTPGAWSDADGDSPPATPVTYTWTVAGSTVSGQTSTTLTGTYFNKGQTVRCNATPTDGTTAGSVVNSNTVTVSNSAPSYASVSLTPTTAYETSTMTCSPSGWSDPDPSDTAGTPTYAWSVGGSAIAQTTSTLTGTYFNKAQAVRCSAAPSDGTTTGSAVNSNSVTILNSAPTTPTPSVTPTSPAAQQDDLVCAMSGSTDADGDPVTYEAEWQWQNYAGTYEAFTLVQSGTNVNDEVLAADTAACRLYRCRARASDGTATSSYSGYSAARTVAAAPGCPSCYTGSSAAGPYSAYGKCWYLTDPGASCDTICGSHGPYNISPSAWNDWPDNCSGIGTDDVASWFYDHGNPAGWGASTGATSYKTLGYGYTGSTRYGKCAAGTSMAHGTWPGDGNQDATRSVACACGARPWEYESSAVTSGTYSNGLMWGPTFRPTDSGALYRAATWFNLTVPVGGGGCSVRWYVMDNSEADYDGPWTIVASGTNIYTSGGLNWWYTADNLSVLLRTDRSYWVAFGTSCSHQRWYDNGYDDLPVMGKALGYCIAPNFLDSPTVTACAAAGANVPAPYYAFQVAD